MLTSEFVTACFYRRSVFLQSSSDRDCCELRSCDACGLERALLFDIEVIDLFLDHLLDTIGHAKVYVLHIDKQFPTLFTQTDQSFCDEVVHCVDHEQRISVCPLMNQRRKLCGKSIVGKSYSQVLCNRFFAEIVEREFLALLFCE